MKVEYDIKADTKYVRIKKGKVASTKKQSDWLIFDCSKNGEVLGVEILNASKNLISLSTIKEKFVAYSTAEFKTIGGGKDGGLELNINPFNFKKEDIFIVT